ncbi:MAG: ribosomal RNA small subunit methyltransferase A [Myxococcales bacterium]|nr:ribosomal RNA small subunit methyltransferase A [Myxococcales bacterium]
MTGARWSSARILRERGLVAKKSFGQNFLQEQAICERIAALAVPEPGGSVLELGAGLGALTAPLADRATHVIAVERDRDLVPLLSELFAASPAVVVLETDAAQLDFCEALGRGPKPWVVAGNLPYQLTGRLLEKTMHVAHAIDRAVFMVQREVCDRLCAAPGTEHYGGLSVFAQAAFRVERALRVPAGAFFPQPQVESAVVVLVPLTPPRAQETDAFKALVKRAFQSRRKKLSNAWRGVFGWTSAELAEHALAAGVSLDVRGETLAVEAYAAMAARAPTGV